MSKFVFTRHLFSCNNSHKKDGNWSRYKEPMISSLGIITGLLLDKGVKTSDVFVSCLIRTWLTAIILYLPDAPDDQAFNLYVSPFIKEKHSDFGLGLDKGNTPLYSIRQQMHMLEYFYSELAKLRISPWLTKIGKDVKKIQDKINTILRKRKSVVIHYFSDDMTNVKDESYGTQLYYSKINIKDCSQKNIVFDLRSGFSYKSNGGSIYPYSVKKVESKTNFKSRELGEIDYKDSVVSLPTNFRYNSYHKNGFFLFMEFIKMKIVLQTYYVVTHSKLMENFLKLLLKEKKFNALNSSAINFEDIYHSIEQTNACDLTFQLLDSTINNAKKYMVFYTSGVPSFEKYDKYKSIEGFPNFDKTPCDYTNSTFKETYKEYVAEEAPTLTKLNNQITRKFNNFTDWFKTRKSGGKRLRRKRSFRR